jgi:hypothetical protein
MSPLSGSPPSIRASTDRDHALGPKPRTEHEAAAHRSAEIRLRDRLAKLGRSREAGKARAIGRGPRLGR